MFALQVYMNDDWLYVTDPHPNGKEGNRILVTFESYDEAKDAGNKGDWSKFRILQISDAEET